MDDSLSCYEPIKTWTDLKNYDKQYSIPSINSPCTERTIPLAVASIQAQIAKLTHGHAHDAFTVTKLHEENDAASGTASSGKIPKVIVCHDFKGGYGDDRFNNGTNNSCNYTFIHWPIVDTFIYFSHNFVTIPPLGWINAAHKHGVKILGTIITEWKEGEALCNEILADSSTIELTVEKLTQIAIDYGFDGYLVNIENKIKPEDIPKLKNLVSQLHAKLKAVNPKIYEVIWYDSVIETGELKWQDELNDKNKLFFDACDGIFLNYNWTDEKLANSREKAGILRESDVFVGVDCFGRGCYGGGGLNTYKAIEKAWTHKLSVAIFAPGWTFECHKNELFQQIDCQLWRKCLEYFGRRAWTLHTGHQNGHGHVPLWSTDFNRGYGQCKFWLGQTVENSTSWFNLSEQSYQPVFLPLYDDSTCPIEPKLDEPVEIHPDLEDAKETDNDIQQQEKDKPEPVIPIEQLLEKQLVSIDYDTSVGFFGGGSIKVSLESKLQNCDELLPFCSIPIQIELKSNEHLGICIAYKNSDDDSAKENVSTAPSPLPQKVIPKVNGMQIACNKELRIPVKVFLPEKVEVENELMFIVSKENTVPEIQMNGWNLTCSIYSSSEEEANNSILTDILLCTTVEKLNIGFVSLIKVSH